MAGVGACALCASACGAPRPPTTAMELPTGPRHPDGVVVEPSPALPHTTDRAPARGVVALREPLGDDAVKEVVRAYVRAFEHEDLDALLQLLTPDASSLSGGRGGRAALIEQWRARMKSYDYSKLQGLEVARLDRIERFAYDELGGAGAPERPAEMRPGDLLVRVPIATPRVGSEALFGDVVVLLLRREGDAYKIAGAGEE